MFLDGEGKSCGWRCPACQFLESNVPNVYRCFCGKFGSVELYIVFPVIKAETLVGRGWECVYLILNALN